MRQEDQCSSRARSSSVPGSRRRGAPGSCTGAPPSGSAQWLRVEAFRRYLADPSARPGPEPLDDDQVRLCTAWAVALGLDDTWRHAAETTAVPTRRPSSHAVRLGPAPAAGLVVSAELASATSSSGGGSGGSSGGGHSSAGVGGGAGGGGGGSW
jgi:uncharacterized membrane protein YgcG